MCLRASIVCIYAKYATHTHTHTGPARNGRFWCLAHFHYNSKIHVFRVDDFSDDICLYGLALLFSFPFFLLLSIICFFRLCAHRALSTARAYAPTFRVVSFFMLSNGLHILHGDFPRAECALSAKLLRLLLPVVAWCCARKFVSSHRLYRFQ